MSRADELRAELVVEELQDQLKAAKADGADTDELKLELREARRAHRELREANAAAQAEEA